MNGYLVDSNILTVTIVKSSFQWFGTPSSTRRTLTRWTESTTSWFLRTIISVSGFVRIPSSSQTPAWLERDMRRLE